MLIIQKIINYALSFAVLLLSLYLIEGACFRLVEPYAKWRLNFAWGEPDLAKLNPIFKSIPTDHSIDPPGKLNFYDGKKSAVEQEFEYAEKITSFNRPTRDRYYNYLLQEVNPLRNFEIIDLGMVNGVVVPGMRRAASPMDVEFGLARREGLPVPFSHALFIYLSPHSSRDHYESQFSRLEGPFSFLLNHGIACLLLAPKSSSEFLSELRYLKSQHPNFAEKIFLYAEGDAVSVASEAIEGESGLVTSFAVKNPTKEINNQTSTSVPWFLALWSQDTDNTEIEQSLVDRVRANRDNPNIYYSKLSGLLFKYNQSEQIALSSDIVSYFLTCLEISEKIEHSTGQASTNTDSNEEEMTQIDDSDIIELNRSVAGAREGGESISQTEPTFECDVVREYRQLHAEDPEIANLSNRELVLTIGSSFEFMGKDVLAEIAEKDPLFYRFYLSLKEIHNTEN
jgi:hypothetical protein